MSTSQRAAGWHGFAAWGLVGALLTLTLLGAASIGLFVLPLALLALLAVGRWVRVWPEVVGVLEGVAALSLFVGIVNLNSRPCPASGASVGGGAGGRFSCGGLHPWPWLTVGVALATAGLAVFVFARPRS